jgi:Holliday junction resolvase RusA-like endonuclease
MVSIKITVVYYHEGATIRVDNDNMLKPIQDALNGRIYVDDSSLEEAASARNRFAHGVGPAVLDPQILNRLLAVAERLREDVDSIR